MAGQISRLASAPQVPMPEAAPGYWDQMAAAKAAAKAEVDRANAALVEAQRQKEIRLYGHTLDDPQGASVTANTATGLGPIAAQRQVSGDVAWGPQPGSGNRAKMRKATAMDKVRDKVAATIAKGNEAIDYYAGPHLGDALGRTAEGANYVAGASPGIGDAMQLGQAASDYADAVGSGDVPGAWGAAALGGSAIFLPYIPAAKGMPAETYDLAMKMKAEGKSAAEIWRATHPADMSKSGWWVNTPDGVPRWETDDSMMSFTPKGKRLSKAPDAHMQPSEPLGTLIKHPEFYDAVPSARGAPSRLVDDGRREGSFGTFYPDRMSVQAYGSQIAGKGEKSLPRITVHEMQHLADNQTGMPTGSNRTDPDRALLAKSDDLIGIRQPENTSPDAIYRRSSGEQLANLTDSRLNMSREGRYGNFPGSGMSSPAAMQWVRWQDGAIDVPTGTGKLRRIAEPRYKGRPGRSQASTSSPTSKGLGKIAKSVPSLEDYTAMVKRGKMQQALDDKASISAVIRGKKPATDLDLNSGHPLAGQYQTGALTDRFKKAGLYVDDDRMGRVFVGRDKATVEGLKNAKNATDYGRAYGYSDDDIAKFYTQRAGGNADIGYQEWLADNYPEMSKGAKAKAKEMAAAAQEEHDAMWAYIDSVEKGDGKKTASLLAKWNKLKKNPGVSQSSASVPEPPPAAPPPSIKAYHGSPHSFDKFSMDKIGTGEGAQAYGHGLYFAENEGIARHYQNNLGHNYMLKDSGTLMDWSNPEQVAAASLFSAKGDRGAAIAANQAFPMDGELGAEVTRLLESDVPLPEITLQKPSMYEVNIDADPNAFLDWDKPLSEQPKLVQEALAAMDPDMYAPGGVDYDPSELGQITYQRLAAQKRDYGIDSGRNNLTTLGGAQAGATDDLKGFGIPGIKYLDAGSRGAGDGTRNYVVFDEKLISIVRKYGIAGASALLGYNVLDGVTNAQADELKKASGGGRIGGLAPQNKEQPNAN